MPIMRLQKFLARAGVASRRKCDEVIIPSGRISVNGHVVTTTGVSVDSESDDIRLDGQVLALPKENITIMLNKPAGFETTMSSQHAGHLVSELVPIDKYPSLVPVGRLDKDTTGLLLFTTDGQMCNALTHPSHHVNKTYIAKVEGNVSEKERLLLEEGVEIDGRTSAPAKCELIKYDTKAGETIAKITIHEGRNRQVRKMFASLGHEVITLHRENLGPLSLGDLKLGSWRTLSEAEIKSLVCACKGF